MKKTKKDEDSYGEKMWKASILHPFLFALFPVLFLFSNNMVLFSFAQALMASTIILSLTLILSVFLSLFFKDSIKTGIAISFFLVMFFSYNHVWNLLYGYKICNIVINRPRYLLPIWSTLIACGIYFIIRTRKKLEGLTKYLNITAVALVAMPLFNIVSFEIKESRYFNAAAVKGNDTTPAVENSGNKSVRRDIYYIILDTYAGLDTLKRLYDFDNREFMEYLKKRGFYVASKSHANYAFTTASLASSLNMEHINWLSDIVGAKSRDETVLYKMIGDNKVVHFLKTKGYKCFYVGGNSKFLKGYDVINSPVRLIEDEFLIGLLSMSMLQPFLAHSEFYADYCRGVTLSRFDELSQLASARGPKFVFTHIMAPHEPFVFGRNGEKVKEVMVMQPGIFKPIWENREGYLNQLIFINKKVETTVDLILSKAGVPPIIILQGDHGPAFTVLGDDLFRERMGILNAYYLPDRDNSILYDSVTPVNTFRLIANLYFNANYGLLGDKSFFSSPPTPFNFNNVTDRLECAKH